MNTDCQTRCPDGSGFGHHRPVSRCDEARSKDREDEESFAFFGSVHSLNHCAMLIRRERGLTYRIVPGDLKPLAAKPGLRVI